MNIERMIKFACGNYSSIHMWIKYSHFSIRSVDVFIFTAHTHAQLIRIASICKKKQNVEIVYMFSHYYSTIIFKTKPKTIGYYCGNAFAT